MIDLDDRSLQLVREILAQQVPDLEVRMFGSRVRGTARKFSDIDLVLVGTAPLPQQTLTDLRDAFAQSDLPYQVDVVDWRVISPEFRNVILDQGYELIQPASGRDSI